MKGTFYVEGIIIIIFTFLLLLPIFYNKKLNDFQEGISGMSVRKLLFGSVCKVLFWYQQTQC